jgi:formyl-CoA transferase
MDLTGEPDGDPQVLGIPLPDMGTSEHSYGLLMKALFNREKTGEGACINMSMYESSVSWLTVPITLSTLLGRVITRRGNTHEFFCPVSVYRTNDGFVYLAVGNDRQWKALVSQDIFTRLDRPEYEKNAGRIADVHNINREINSITENHTSAEIIELLKGINIPVSKINKVSEVVSDPLVQRRLLRARDPKSGLEVTLAPPPNMTPFMEERDRELSFPPRFGEHNRAIYGGELGYSEERLAELEKKGVI